MKSGSTRAMGQNRKHRALKLLLPLLAFTLLLGFGPQAGVSYAEPSEGTGTTTSPAPATDPSGDPAATPADPASPGSAGAPASSTQENAPTSGQQAPAQPNTKPVKAPSGSVDLASFLTGEPKLFYGGAELTKDEEGNYTIHPDTPYKLQLGFQETPAVGSTPGKQFPTDGTTEMVYQLPAGLQAFPLEDPVEFDMATEDNGTVAGNKYWVQDNQIHVQLANDNAIGASQQARFYVTLDVKFAKDAENIALTDDIHLKVKISNNPDLTIVKSARHDFAAGKVFYTLTVTSIDTNENVLISDQINGKESVLTLDEKPENIKVKSNKQKNLKPKDLEIENNGFHLIIPKMTHGEQVTVEYFASVDYSKIDPEVGGTVEQTKNDAKVVSDQIPAEKETTNDLASQLKIGTITKNAGAAKETTPKSGIYEQSWTLDVNKYWKLKVAGNTVKDSIPEEFQKMMKYSGDGITVVVNKGRKDADGNSIEQPARLIKWADVGITDLDTQFAWSYILPKDDPENSSYEITYTTQVDVTKQIVPTSVKNEASNEKKDTQETPEKVVAPTSGLKPPHIFNVEKKAFSANPAEVTWEVAVNVVPQGYDSLVLTDTLPAAKSGENSFQDTLKDTSIEVEGLLEDEGEGWTFAKDEKNPDSGFTIKFFKNKEQNVEGLLENTAMDDQQKPIERTVKVKFTTKNSADWVTAYRAGDESLYRHVNRVKATANGIDRTASAAATPDPEGIHKTFNGIKFNEIGGVDYPVFNYRLRLEGLDKYKEESFQITDKFDAKLLKLADDPVPNVSGEKNLKITQQDGVITFEMQTAKLPKDSDKLRSVYYLDYSLIPVSRAALIAINKNPEGLKVSNTATWGPVKTKDVKADYLYGPLTKQLTEKPTNSNNYEATFKVIINPGALDIAHGAATAKFKDRMTNMRLQPETLKMTPADFPYHPVYKDGVLTMEVPNKRKVVVTYKAKVIGKGLINYGNEVKVGHEQSAVNGSVAVRMGGGGDLPNPGITIHKHDSRDLTTNLAGAEFELYQIIDGEPQPLGGKLNKDQEPVEQLRFTTDKNGEVKIKGHYQNLGWSLLVSDENKQYEYQLKEVKSPKGYKLLEKPINFTIWRNPADETQQYDGAYIYVANEPEPGTKIPGNPGDLHKKLGDTGAQVSVALGAMLACLAGGYLILRRREQR